MSRQEAAHEDVQHCTSALALKMYSRWMMSPLMARLLRLAGGVCDACMSAFGCLVFTRGFSSMAVRTQGLAAEPRYSAGIGAGHCGEQCSSVIEYRGLKD